MIDRSQIKILLVDDEPTIRDSLDEFLGDCGFAVSSCESGEDALDQIRQESHSVAIIDMRLPGMTGDELILRAHQLQPSLKFLILTGSIDFQISEDLKKVGVQSGHILKKPLPNLFHLVKVVESLTQE